MFGSPLGAYYETTYKQAINGSPDGLGGCASCRGMGAMPTVTQMTAMQQAMAAQQAAADAGSSNKKLYWVLGGVALLGVGAYFLLK